MPITYPKGVSIDRANEACVHHSNLNMFAAVVELMENGMIQGKHATRNAQRIIALAKAAQQVELAGYDKALGRREVPE